MEQRPAIVLAALAFLVFAAMVLGIATDTFALDNRAEAWVGAGLVGLGSLVLTAWAIVIYAGEPLDWAERVGGDLLLAGLGVLLVAAGLPTFLAGVI